MELAITEDVARNMLVTNRVVKEVQAGHTCLVLVSRKKHVTAMTAFLVARGVEAKELSGLVAKGKRKTTLNDMREGKLACGVGTLALLTEGVDLTTP